MITIPPNVEDALTHFLQKKISFEVDGRVFKTGKLILFSSKYFFICFTLKTDKKSRDKLEIPIPFSIEHHAEDNLIYFDYRVDTLTKCNSQAKELLEQLPLSKNKFINKILTIEAHNEN